MQNKIHSIQALRGISVLLVIFYHLIPIENKYNPLFVLSPNLFKIGNIGVDIFFMISGFIMVVVTQNYHKCKISFIKFLYSRFTRIYGPYWFYSLLLLVVYFIKPEWVNSSQNSDINIISSLLLIPEKNLPLIMVGWSLIHEIYFYIVFSFFLLFFSKQQIFKFSILWISILVIGNFYFSIDSPFLDLIFHPLTCEFILGLFLGVYYLKFPKVLINSKFILFIPFIFLIIVAWFLIGPLHDWERLLVYGGISMLIVFSSIELEKIGFIFNKKLIQIGDASYSIYLSHLLVLNTVGKVFNVFLTENIIFEIILVISMITASILWGLFSFKYIETPLNIFFKDKFSRLNF